ncbi:MAG: Rnase Y domain-containing protein, partial [Bacteroidota bacterium]
MGGVYIIVAGVAGLILGVVIGQVLLRKVFKAKETEAEDKAKLIIQQAETKAEGIKKDRILQAKEKYLAMKSDFEQDVNKRKNQLQSAEQKHKDREKDLHKQIERAKRKDAELDSQRENLNAQMDIVQKRKDELERIKSQQVSMLEKVSNLTADEAKDQLMATLVDEAETKASSHIKDILEEAKMRATKQSKKVVIETILRTATEHAMDNCVSVFNI